MIDHVLQFTAPAGYALLPPLMRSTRATALLLAIGLQESQFLERRQGGQGPARGFWQFEKGTVITRGGVTGVMLHASTRAPLEAALRALRYEALVGNSLGCHAVLEHNDTLAFVFARLLLWTVPGALPHRDEADRGWQQYLAGWNPGDPHPATWDANFEEAWERVDLNLDPTGRPFS